MWFQPYYRPQKRGIRFTFSSHPVKKNKVRTNRVKKVRSRQALFPQRSVSDVGNRVSGARDIPAVRVMNYPHPLDKVMGFKNLPAPGEVWSYHDRTRHQVVAHFVPGSGSVYRGRSGAARKKLKPLVYPKIDKPYDRTHLIPVGYHGSESDQRLLIGWDSRNNQGPLNDFERRQRGRKEAIIWMTTVKKTGQGARWEYRIYRASDRELLDKYEWDYTANFAWT